MSDNNPFLAVAGNMYQRPDPDNILFIFKALNLYLNGIGDLFLLIYKYFFPNYLRSKKPFIFICELIFRKIRRTLRKLAQIWHSEVYRG